MNAIIDKDGNRLIGIGGDLCAVGAPDNFLKAGKVKDRQIAPGFENARFGGRDLCFGHDTFGYEILYPNEAGAELKFVLGAGG